MFAQMAVEPQSAAPAMQSMEQKPPGYVAPSAVVLKQREWAPSEAHCESIVHGSPMAAGRPASGGGVQLPLVQLNPVVQAMQAAPPLPQTASLWAVEAAAWHWPSLEQQPVGQVVGLQAGVPASGTAQANVVEQVALVSVQFTQRLPFAPQVESVELRPRATQAPVELQQPSQVSGPQTRGGLHDAPTTRAKIERRRTGNRLDMRKTLHEVRLRDDDPRRQAAWTFAPAPHVPTVRRAVKQ